MGCWNGTCGVSQLPIHCGDSVVLFILEESPYKDERGTGGVCYSTGLWRPMFVPIFGLYDDYGRIEEVEAGTEFIVDYFNSVINKGSKGYTNTFRRLNRMKREYSNDPKERELQEQRLDDTPFKHIEDLISAISEGDLFYKYNFMGDIRDRRYGYMMVHRHIYEELIKEMAVRKPYSETQTIETLIRNKRLRQLNEIRGLGNFDEQIIELLDDGQSLADLTPEIRDALIRMIKMSSSMDRIFESSHSANLNNKILDHINGNEILSVEAVADLLVNYYLFGTCMEFMRKFWQPQAGAGSQCGETMLFKVLNKAMQKVVTRERWNEKQKWGKESLFWYNGP